MYVVRKMTVDTGEQKDVSMSETRALEEDPRLHFRMHQAPKCECF